MNRQSVPADRRGDGINQERHVVVYHFDDCKFRAVAVSALSRIEYAQLAVPERRTGHSPGAKPQPDPLQREGGFAYPRAAHQRSSGAGSC